MHKTFVTLVAGVAMAVGALYGFSVVNGPQQASAVVAENPEGESANGMTEPEARALAEKSCIKGGEALAIGMYNRAEQTWWFEANLNATRLGCTPGCVVNEVTKTAEVLWKCDK